MDFKAGTDNIFAIANVKITMCKVKGVYSCRNKLKLNYHLILVWHYSNFQPIVLVSTEVFCFPYTALTQSPFQYSSSRQLFFIKKPLINPVQPIQLYTAVTDRDLLLSIQDLVAKEPNI